MAFKLITVIYSQARLIWSNVPRLFVCLKHKEQKREKSKSWPRTDLGVSFFFFSKIFGTKLAIKGTSKAIHPTLLQNAGWSLSAFTAAKVTTRFVIFSPTSLSCMMQLLWKGLRKKFFPFFTMLQVLVIPFSSLRGVQMDCHKRERKSMTLHYVLVHSLSPSLCPANFQQFPLEINQIKFHSRSSESSRP